VFKLNGLVARELSIKGRLKIEGPTETRHVQIPGRRGETYKELPTPVMNFFLKILEFK
jgi:hypothetical protein